ncbi:MAG: hypothetical protein ACTHK7_22265, partial [Aureliella sp.]
MHILLVNAGSSSLKCTLMDSASEKVYSHALMDWAGSVTRYSHVGSDGKEHVQEVSWK